MKSQEISHGMLWLTCFFWNRDSENKRLEADHGASDNYQEAMEPVDTPWLPSNPESGQNWESPTEWASDLPENTGSNWDSQGSGWTQTTN